MKKILIKFLIILIAIILVNTITFNTISYASSADDIISQGDGFLSKADKNEVINTDALKVTSGNIYNILFTIGVVLSVAIGMIIGIQFIMGSVEEKAKIKETLVPYVVGVFIIFAAFTIWKIAVNIGNEIATTQEKTSDGWITPPTTGVICPYCSKDMGEIPAGVIVGGRQYPCPNCHKYVQF